MPIHKVKGKTMTKPPKKPKDATAAAVAETDVNPEVLRELVARSVTFVGLTLVAVLVIGTAAVKLGAVLRFMAETAPF
jgi:hypothetical protein